MASKSENNMKRWIAETQMFQRIAKTEESSYEELKADWESWNNPRRDRALASIITHRAIQEAAQHNPSNPFETWWRDHTFEYDRAFSSTEKALAQAAFEAGMQNGK